MGKEGRMNVFSMVVIVAGIYFAFTFALLVMNYEPMTEEGQRGDE
jgi:hypothetical protein